MNIVKPYARINRINGMPFFGEAGGKAVGIEALRYIEWCGRISHRSEEAQTLESWERFIRPRVWTGWSIAGLPTRFVRHREENAAEFYPATTLTRARDKPRTLLCVGEQSVDDRPVPMPEDDSS